MRGTLASFVLLATSAYAVSVAERVAELRGLPTQADRIRTLEDPEVCITYALVRFSSLMRFDSTSSTSCLLLPALPLVRVVSPLLPLLRTSLLSLAMESL